MALPPLKKRVGDVYPSYGITVTVSPSTEAGADIVIQEQPFSSTGTWVEVSRQGLRNGAPMTVTFMYPNDGVRRFFRAYDAEAGWNNSTYTSVVSAYPVQLSAGTVQPPITMLPVNAPLSLSTRAVPTYKSTSGSTGAYKKSIFYPFTGFVANTSTVKWQVVPSVTRGAFMSPSTFGGATFQNYWTDIIMPPGATITNVTAALYRQSTADVSQLILHREPLALNAAVVNVATLTATPISGGGTTGFSFPSATVSETVSTVSSYIAQVSLKGTTAAFSARFAWLRLDYTIPSLGVGL